jgi:hypothetical protein
MLPWNEKIVELERHHGIIGWLMTLGFQNCWSLTLKKHLSTPTLKTILHGLSIPNFSEFALLVDTVKASNFGPHGNFGPLFQKGLLSLKRVLQNHEDNKSCRTTLDLQIRFCSFFVHDLSTEATELTRKSSKFP